ncbi:PREDICTED: protein TIFY 7 [Tarenaya hassleriana]|uniref:protein TIFY 7 n=1 Tax=Tarenaya hassleriana TaxID=28532 RepID=UPI00053C2043|nr:PREDICTED: protein TIFY 7 [Tarenaya hassleriana]
MERDFMGLRNRSQSLRKVKPEVNRDDSGVSKKGSAVEWAKYGGPPNFMSARDLHVMKRRQLGGVNHTAMTNPSPLLPSLNSFAAFSDPRNNVASSAPQLTVFYAGTVNVFNDISPEKAQAIMLWAGNGLSLSSMVENEKGKTGDIAYGKHPPKAKPAVSASSTSGTHSPTRAAINLMGSFCSASSIIPSVPQARKASLARFLEKRKERLMNAMPYSMSKMKLMECSTGESTGMNYSATSAA